MNRTEFLKTLGAAVGATVAAPILDLAPETVTTVTSGKITKGVIYIALDDPLENNPSTLKAMGFADVDGASWKAIGMASSYIPHADVVSIDKMDDHD